MPQQQFTIAQALELAQKFHSAGQLQQAEAIYQQILAAQPKNADAMHLSGVVALQTGRLDDAHRMITRAIAIQPNDPAYLSNLGLVYLGQNRFAEAVAPLQQAVTLNPNLPESWSNLGYALRGVGRFDEAIAACRKALVIRPGYFDASMNLGAALQAAGEFDQAISIFQNLAQARPNVAEVQFNLATALRARGQLDPAIDHFRRAVALRPNMVDAINLLGVSLSEKGQLDEAMATLSHALAVSPNSPGVMNNLGHCLHAAGQFDRAIEVFRRATALDPRFGECWNNLGNSLRAAGKLQEAVAAYREAIKLRPELAEAHVDLGVGLQEMEKIDEAIVEYEQALRLKPQLATAHYNLSLALMLKGDLERGFVEYAWRENVKDLQGLFQTFPQPRWDGRELGEDQRLLIHAEQGMGDTIQFVRYLPKVAQRVKRIVLACQPPLKRLLQSIPGIEQFATHGEPLLDFQMHCPLLSLPRIFKTTLETIPDHVPYLKAEPQLIERWRERMGDEKRLKVGLAWSGKRQQKNNRNRSIPPHLLAPLMQAADVRWFCLQKDQSPPYEIDPAMKGHLTDWTGELDDFAQTAALLENLDLLITSDTSVAHLAGALGRPVWVLMAMAPDFRWMLGRGDSPWYPTMRLFRQEQLGQWQKPIENIVEQLKSFRTSQR